MSYFLENEEAVKEQEILQDETSVQQENEQDGIASIEPLLDNRIVRAIREMGFEKLSPIQEQAIPLFITGRGHHRTGTDRYRQDRSIRYPGHSAYQSGREEVTDDHPVPDQRTGDPGERKNCGK